MASPRVALYVRIPPDQARRLDDRARSLDRSKQDLITDLITGCLDQVDGDVRGRETDQGSAANEVLTLAELSVMLRIDEPSIMQRVLLGEIPGRKLGDEWRFARQAVISWLEGTDGSRPGPGFRARS